MRCFWAAAYAREPDFPDGNLGQVFAHAGGCSPGEERTAFQPAPGFVRGRLLSIAVGGHKTMPAGSASRSRCFDARLPVAAHGLPPPPGRLVLGQPHAPPPPRERQGVVKAKESGFARPGAGPYFFEFWVRFLVSTFFWL
jgi:hypothetical protein